MLDAVDTGGSELPDRLAQWYWYSNTQPVALETRALAGHANRSAPPVMNSVMITGV